MKKHTPYKVKEYEPTVLSEPLVPYLPMAAAMPLNRLKNMSMQDISHSDFTGQTLVDIQKETSLSPNAIAGVVGVSKSKYYDLVKLKSLGSKNIDALADFAMLWQKGIDAFDGDKDLLNEWLEIRNENLGNIKPIVLLSSRIGRRDLEKAFLRIEYSTYG